MRIVRALSTLCLLAGMALGLAAWYRPVTVVAASQEPLTGGTWYTRVADVLASWGIGIRGQDAVWPSADSRVYRNAVIVLRRAIPVQWYADGQHGRLWTQPTLVGNVLQEAGVRLFPGDEVWLDGAPVQADSPLDAEHPHTLQVQRAILWDVDTPQGRVRTQTTASGGLVAALWEARIPMFAGDAFSPAWDAAPQDAPFQWRPSRMVTVVSAYGTLRARVTGETVGEALGQIGLFPQGLDYTLPPLEAALPEDGRIQLVRVREEVLVEQQPVPFGVEYRALPDVEIGEIRVLQNGQYGVEARQVRVRWEDGVEVSRVVEATERVQEPLARVLGYGTLAVPRTVQTPEGTLTYWRAAQVYVTSYSPCRLGIPNYCNDITASGQRLRKGLVAVTRRQYAALAGSQVYVPGYGIGTVADIGAGFAGREWLDLGYSDDEFVSWHQTVTVYYLWPPPEDLTWLIP
ncbi:MAG: hypothetical protein D6755_11400 [Anaerolineae bacterium]|nr:MAG: hypothetical protein D6755_11400 [Anaerolineae bacterium]